MSSCFQHDLIITKESCHCYRKWNKIRYNKIIGEKYFIKSKYVYNSRISIEIWCIKLNDFEGLWNF